MKGNVKAVCLGLIKFSEFIGNSFIIGYNLILPRRTYKSMEELYLKRVLPYTLAMACYVFALIQITKNWEMSFDNLANAAALLMVPGTMFGFIMTVVILQSIRVLNYKDSNDKYEWLTHTRFEEK